MVFIYLPFLSLTEQEAADVLLGTYYIVNNVCVDVLEELPLTLNIISKNDNQTVETSQYY